MPKRHKRNMGEHQFRAVMDETVALLNALTAKRRNRLIDVQIFVDSCEILTKNPATKNHTPSKTMRNPIYSILKDILYMVLQDSFDVPWHMVSPSLIQRHRRYTLFRIFSLHYQEAESAESDSKWSP